MILSPLPPSTSTENEISVLQSTNRTGALPELWCQCRDIYPPAKEIVEALQDPGRTQKKVIKGCQQNVTTFPRIQKLCSKIYSQIQTIYKPSGLTKNVSRGREALATLVLMYRKAQDVIHLDSFFHQFARAGMVYIITNDTA